MKRVCIYPGTFSPITRGHEWIIAEALKLFDVVNVLVATNRSKAPVFSREQRIKLIMDVTHGLDGEVNVLTTHDSYTVNVAKDVKATHIIRGIRSGVDFDYERNVDLINRDICREAQADGVQPFEISTIYVTPPRHLCEVSSSMVMSLVGFRGWQNVVKNYVSPRVFETIKQDYEAGRLPGRP